MAKRTECSLNSTLPRALMHEKKYVLEDKFKFQNSRLNPEILAAPHLSLTEHNLPLTEHC